MNTKEKQTEGVCRCSACQKVKIKFGRRVRDILLTTTETVDKHEWNPEEKLQIEYS